MSTLILTLEQVSAWTWERNHGGLRVPVLPREEQEEWVRLSALKAETRLPEAVFLLWAALDRKVQYRHVRNYAARPTSGGRQQDPDRKRRRYCGW
jgi:hypothetical protein